MSLLAFQEGRLDRARMRRERFARLQREMTVQGVDALLLLGTANTYYASGAGRLEGDSSRAKLEPVAVLVTADDTAPHIFTPDPEGIPPEVPDDHRHAALLLEFDAGVEGLCDQLSVLVGQRSYRLGIDQYSAAMFELLPKRVPGVKIVDAAGILGPARLFKTQDEIECLRRAHSINDLAMAEVQKHLRGGVTQAELTGLFYRRIHELGATTNLLDPMWDIIGKRKQDFVPSTHGDLPFPLAPNNLVLDEGTVLWMDTGIAYEGYGSDFGRTWIVSENPSPSPALRDQYKRYRDVIAAALDIVQPGKTGHDLTCAAKKAGGGKVWLDHFYLGHGIGLSSAEPPLIGTDLGEAFDRSIELHEGMVFVLEPVCWTEGVGGFRAEETIAVTADGYIKLNDYPYAPFE